MENPRIFDLQKRISLANHAYANGAPYLTDYEYDQLWQELRSLDPTNPELYHTSASRTPTNLVNHPIKVLSLSKAFDQEDLKVFLTRFRRESFVVQPKFDGIAVMLYPVPDDFPYPYRAVKSGDGISGADISHHLPYMKIPSHKGPRLSCEALILWEDWSPELGANPRNVAAGLIARHSLESYPNLISLVPHDSVSLDLEASPEKVSSVTDTLLDIYNHFLKTYPCDGLVLKLKDPKRRLVASHNGVYPFWAIAWKPPMQVAQTEVTSISWNVSRTGRVIPTVHYDPVNLCSTENSSATANNYKWLIDRSLGVGSKIRLGKAGEIIPQIVEVLTSGDPQTPDVCPFCGSALSVSSVDLICLSKDCLPQKINQLSYFYGQHGLDIKYIGPKMLEDILKNQVCYLTLRDSPWALLEPKAFGISMYVRTIIGEGNYQRFLESLEDAPSPDPARFMAALGYPKLGYKTSLWFFHKSKGLTPEGKTPSSESFMSFRSALSDISKAMEELQSFSLSPLPKPTTIKYSITGLLSINRNELISRLASYGWKFIGSVSKQTDYLILGELENETKKLKDAKHHGTTILSENDLNLNWEDTWHDTCKEDNLEPR